MRSSEKTQDSFVNIDLHLHSDKSDGSYTPEELSHILAKEGIFYAVLTDHKTTDGLLPFHHAAVRQGISDITGVEIHAIFDNTELHLLAYGFDPNNASLKWSLSGVYPVEDAISAVHDASGLAVLAHPLNYGWSDSELRTALRSLVKIGLDGIEAYYKAYTREQQDELLHLADRMSIVCTGGSDFHGCVNDKYSPGVKMPVRRWKRFREVLGEHARNAPPVTPSAKERTHGISEHINWKWLLMRIALPSLLVIVFFIVLIFAVLIPNMESLLLERKKETTIELTNSAYSILQDYHRAVETGSLTLSEAQLAARDHIRQMRYGPDSKDYFWITDMDSYMVMHPYRRDLEGVDLSDFTDPDGVRLFVEFAKKVTEHSSGYVRYIWQWQDDPERMEAKESYVKGFEPWGWIIGTGLYVEDVQKQIDKLTGNMIDISFIVVVISAVLLLLISLQTLKLEQLRIEAEQELRLSHERYQALVESSSTGTLLLADKRCAYANKALLDILGYTSREIAFLDLHDIIALPDITAGTDMIQKIAGGYELTDQLEVRLRKKDGVKIPALLSANTILLSGKEAVILSIQDITQHHARQNNIERDRLLSRLQTSMLYLTEPVSHLMSSPLSCLLDTSIGQAVNLMNKKDQNVITVLGPKNEILGIITDKDIRKRVIGAQLDLKEPVSRIMSSPVVSINEDAPVFQAIMLEQEKNIDHLAVTDTSNKLVGIIRSSQLLKADQYSPMVVIQQIRTAKSIDEIAECYNRLPSIIGSLVDTGALPQNICQIISTVSDTISLRIIEFILKDIGPAPVPFAVLVLGSEARKEQTLATDQDNALVYEDSEADSEIADYFMQFGEKLCEALNTVGYKYCKGGNMANNKKWNQPLKQWKQYYNDWITEPVEEALAYCSVFFDQRCVYGDSSLLNELRVHIYALQEQNPAFLSHMALNTLNYKVPLGLFGRILTGTEGEHGYNFNIKDAVLPIVNFARLYAFRHKIEETNTLERLEKIHLLKILHDESFRAISQSYNHLLKLRFSHQVEMIKSGKDADNFINPASLTQMDESMLKNSLSQISVIQKKVSYEFHAT